jgi:hypothetical protein
VKVTRVAYSRRLNAGKLTALTEQAERLGGIRAEVWRRYGSVAGAALSDRQVRDRWMTDGTAAAFGVLANAWKETVRDAMGDIRASREAAKAEVRRAVSRRGGTDAERKRLFIALKADEWAGDPYLSRMMRKHWRRGHSHTRNQIIIRADNYRTFTLAEGGDVWLSIPGLLPRETGALPGGRVRTEVFGAPARRSGHRRRQGLHRSPDRFRRGAPRPRPRQPPGGGIGPAEGEEPAPREDPRRRGQGR